MSFIFNGVSSDTMKFNVTSRQVYNAPAYDLNAIEVPGRSGDLLNPQNRFKNKQVSYTGFLKASDFEGSTWREKLSTGLIQLKGWLCSDAGSYHELTDDYDPGFTRYGYISGETAISDIQDRPFGVTLTVAFNVKPYMYKAGEPMELPETKSASGSIITITDGADNTPLKSAVVNIEPVQDLHGYSYPWPAGGGKNLLGSSIATQTISTLSITDNGNGVITLNGTSDGNQNLWRSGVGSVVVPQKLTSGKTYSLSGITGYNTGTFYAQLIYKGDTSNNLISFVTTNGAQTIQLTENATFFEAYLNTRNGASFTNVRVSVQFEEGSPTSWTPYSNICPISGWSEAKVWVKPTYDTSLTPTATIPLGRTVYGGTLDVVRGKLNAKPYYASYSGQTLVGPWISSHDKYVAGATPTTGAQVVDMGAAGTDHDVTPQTIKTLLGVNNIWANTGETEVEYIVPTENPTQWPSQPRLEITMSGAGTLTVNGKTWSIGSYTGTLICDSEIMDWYDAGALKNSLVSGDGFPELVPGDNVITYTGGITKVVATPRWRTL